MGRLGFVLKFAIVAAFFSAIGYFLHDFFRFIPDWAHALVTGIIFGLIALLVFIKRKKYSEQGEGVEIPEIFQASIYLFLIAGALFGFYFSRHSFKTYLYVDNGKEVAATVSVLDGESFTVDAHDFNRQSVPVAPINIVVNGVVKNLNITEAGNWVFNIDSINTYVETSIQYTTEEATTDEADSTKNALPKFNIIRGEFFKSKADYVFKAPESISVNKKDKDKDVTKFVLYRLGEGRVE